VRGLHSLTLLLHAGRPPAPHDLWTSWPADPIVYVGLAVAGSVYARGVHAARQHAGGRAVIAGSRVAAMYAGLAALWLALLTPVDALGAALFTAHMVQHLLLMIVAAPLIAAGLPALVFFWALPFNARRSVARWWVARTHARRVVAICMMPVVAAVLHSLALWLWHVPRLYDAAVTNAPLHLAEHATFFYTALLFWWTVVAPQGHEPSTRRVRADVVAIVVVLLVAIQATALGAILTLATEPWYDAHVVTTRVWGLTQLEDQQLAGAIMWMPASIPYLAALLVLAARQLRTTTGRDGSLAPRFIGRAGFRARAK